MFAGFTAAKLMDSSSYLQSQGWKGDGHSLKEDRGLKRPILVSNKQDVLGIGVKKPGARLSDQWWMRAFDSSLQGLEVQRSTKTTVHANGAIIDEIVVTQTKNGGLALNSVSLNPGSRWHGLYGGFVAGTGLDGTIDMEDVEIKQLGSSKDSSKNGKDIESNGVGSSNVPVEKREKKMRKRKAELSTVTEQEALKSTGHESSPEPSSDFSSERAKRKKHDRKAAKEAKSATQADSEPVEETSKQLSESEKKEKEERRIAKKARKEEKKKRREEKAAREDEKKIRSEQRKARKKEKALAKISVASSTEVEEAALSDYLEGYQPPKETGDDLMKALHEELGTKVETDAASHIHADRQAMIDAANGIQRKRKREDEQMEPSKMPKFEKLTNEERESQRLARWETSLVNIGKALGRDVLESARAEVDGLAVELQARGKKPGKPELAKILRKYEIELTEVDKQKAQELGIRFPGMPRNKTRAIPQRHRPMPPKAERKARKKEKKLAKYEARGWKYHGSDKHKHGNGEEK